jgi:hypothetical protein
VKPWILPAGLTAVVGAAVLATSLSGAAPLPAEQVRESATRVSVVCPAFNSAATRIRVAAQSANEKVRTAKLSAPQKTTDTDGLAVVADPGEPVRVSVAGSQLFGATTSASAGEGPGRGLSLTSCLAPSAEFWFTGVDVTDAAQSDLVLVNLDSTDAVVDLVAYGAGGRLSAPRGLTVKGNSSNSVALGAIPRHPDPITVKVSTSQGRVAAFIRQITWQGNTPLAAEWVPSGVGPVTDQVLPGIPAGKGKRLLLVTNPGELTADVGIDVLGPSGRSQLAGAERLQVPPGVTSVVDLAPGLAGQAAAVQLTSSLPVIAGLSADNGLAPLKYDTVVDGSTPAIPADALWPVALGKQTVGTLQLVNPTDADVVVNVSLTAGTKGTPQVTPVTVAASSTAQVALPKTDAVSIRIQTESTAVRAAVLATASLGGVKGTAVLDLVANESRAHKAEVVFNPHLA